MLRGTNFVGKNSGKKFSIFVNEIIIGSGKKRMESSEDSRIRFADPVVGSARRRQVAINSAVTEGFFPRAAHANYPVD